MTQPHLDLKTIENLREIEVSGIPNFVSTVVNVFLTQVPKYLETLQQTLKRTDQAHFETTAHTLKGSCSNFGAICLMELCEKLEKLDIEQEPQKARQLFEEINCEFTIVRQILETQTKTKN